MKFMNKKEQVLDLQLTPYGVDLLKKGQLNPVYYSFSDNNILYDIQFASGSEDQNSIEPRIQDSTPQLETLKSTRTMEDWWSSLSDFPVTGDLEMEDVVDFIHFISETNSSKAVTAIRQRGDVGLPQDTLGDSSLQSQNAAAWNILMLNGEISGSARTEFEGDEDSEIYVVNNVPQLDITLEYKTYIYKKSEVPGDIFLEVEPALGDISLGPDELTPLVSPDFILAQVMEKNVDFTKDNFEIEVFKAEEFTVTAADISDVFSYESLTQLLFQPRRDILKDNMILKSAEEIDSSATLIDKQNVEYYFDIFCDSEIQDSVICQSIEKLKSNNFLDKEDEYDCRQIAADAKTFFIYDKESEGLCTSEGDIPSPFDSVVTDL